MSLEQIQAFSEACEEIKFAGRIRKEIYGWVEQTLVGQQYHILGKEEKGVLRGYLGKMTGFSRAQVTRLIAACEAETRDLQAPIFRRTPCLELLAALVAEAYCCSHRWLSGILSAASVL